MVRKKKLYISCKEQNFVFLDIGNLWSNKTLSLRKKCDISDCSVRVWLCAAALLAGTFFTGAAGQKVGNPNG